MLTATITALRYLSARKLRATLTTLAVVFGVAVIFAGNLVLPSAMASFRRAIQGAALTADLTINPASGTSFAPGTALDSARGVPGVAAASGVIERAASVPRQAGQPAEQITLIGVDPASFSAVRGYTLAAGRFLEPGERGTVVVGDSTATLGEAISLPTTAGLGSYIVIGKIDRAGLPSTEVVMALADAQEALGIPGRITAIEIALEPGANRDAVGAAVLAALGSGYRLGAASPADTVGSLGVAFAIFNMIGALALFIGAFLIFNTFHTIVLERRRDLGMLRAIGADRSQITAILLIESLIQGVVGSLLGMVAGGGLALLLLAGVRAVGRQFLGGLDVAVDFSPAAALPALAAGIGTTLLAGYLPARAAGRVTPLEALRPASLAEERRSASWSLSAGVALALIAVGLLFAGPRAATGGALLFLLGIVLASPALIGPVARLFGPLLTSGFAGEGEIAQGNLRRQPGRAAITASTLMIGLAVTVMLTSVISSFDRFVVDLFNRNFASDIILLPQNIALLGSNLGSSERLANELRAVPGVSTVGTLRTATTKIDGTALNLIGIDPATYPAVSPLLFEQGEAATAYPALTGGRAAILNPIAAATLGLRAGDLVTLETRDGPQPYTINAVGGDALNFKINTLFISQANLAQDFGASEDMMLLLKGAPGADLGAIERAVRAASAAYPQFTVTVTAQFRQQMIGLSQGVLRGAFIPLALIVLLPATLGLLNTLTMNVIERTREIGIMRAVGASAGQVRRIVLVEAALLGLFGASFGALAGLAMSYGFTTALGSAFGVRLPFSLPLLGIVAAFVLGSAVTLIASALPARAAARLNILQALRYE